MLKIRLRRMGSAHRPFYRVVVSDSARVPTASAVEEIGYYNPRENPSVLSIDLERADYWMERGAQPSDTVKNLLKRARKNGQNPLAPPLAPGQVRVVTHDAGEAEAPAATEAKTEDAPAEEPKAEDAPATEAATGDDEAKAADDATAEAEASTDDAASEGDEKA
ncbi:MAG: 30S ribosomal protein S16 [Acidobacteriota bacterium]